jgi:hypothetical protein
MDSSSNSKCKEVPSSHKWEASSRCQASKFTTKMYMVKKMMKASLKTTMSWMKMAGLFQPKRKSVTQLILYLPTDLKKSRRKKTLVPLLEAAPLLLPMQALKSRVAFALMV